MAAPSATSRGTPSGIKLEDGFSTLVTLEDASTLGIWETEVTPPGYEGGDAIPTTTMHNSSLRTFAPSQLKTLTECSFTGAFDPGAYTTVASNINVEQTITVTFPDGSTVAFFGYLMSFQPNGMSEGEFPLADVTIQPTNWDPDNNEEAGPTVSSVAGT